MLGRDPASLSSYDILSFFLMYDEEKDAHEEWYLSMLEERPSQAGLALGLGNLYFNSRRFEDACPWYKRCLELQCDQRIVYEKIALCAYESFDMPELNSLLQKITWITPTLFMISGIKDQADLEFAIKMT